MSDLITLELNQNNAHIVRDNGDYQVKLAKPIQIEPGDSIRLRMASIDSQKAQSNTVVITEDMGIGMVYSYWDYDYTPLNKMEYDPNNIQDNYAGNTWASSVFDYFAMYSETPIVTFKSALCTIKGAYASGYNQQLNMPISGTFIVNQALASQRNIKLPPGYDFIVTCQYIDPDGNYQTIQLTGTNAAFGVVPGSANQTQVYYQTSIAPGDFSFILGPVDGGTFEFQKGTMSAIGVQGVYPGTYGSAKADQNILETISGSQPPSRGTQPHNIIIGSSTTSVDLVELAFDFEPPTNPEVGGFHQLKLNTQNVTLKAGSYDPASLAVKLTQLFNGINDIYPQGSANNPGPLMGKNQFMTITNQGSNVKSIFRILDFETAGEDSIAFNTGNTYQYQQNAANNYYIPTYVGASKFIVEYGTQQGQVYAIPYMHMPLECPNTGAPTPPPQEAVAYIAITTGASYEGAPVVHWQPVRAASGIAIHQLEPQEFWQDTLGIYDQVIVPLRTVTGAGNTRQYYLKQDLVDKITEGFASRQGLLPASGVTDNWRSAPVTAANLSVIWVDTEGATKSIIGDTVQTKSSGYFLLEVQGLTRRREGYVDSKQSNPGIQGVISTQFDSNDRVTGFADAGLEYVHLGAGYLVTELSIRILDPQTRELASNLGDQNSIIMDVIKGNAQPIVNPPILPSGRK